MLDDQRGRCQQDPHTTLINMFVFSPLTVNLHYTVRQIKLATAFCIIVNLLCNIRMKSSVPPTMSFIQQHTIIILEL